MPNTDNYYQTTSMFQDYPDEIQNIRAYANQAAYAYEYENMDDIYDRHALHATSCW